MKWKMAVILTAAVLMQSVSQAEEVEANWNKHCAKCHGKAGKGDTKMGQKLGVKDYTDPKVQEAMTDEAMVKTIKTGLVEDGKEKMKAYADLLSDSEIKALVEHVRKMGK